VKFCTSCGRVTNRGRKSLRKEFARRGAPQRRAAGAVGLLFMGVVISLLVQARWGDHGQVLQACLNVVVGLVALAMLGWPSPERILGGRKAGQSMLSQAGIGVVGGCVGFGIAWGYMYAILSLVGSESSGVPAGIPWWTIVIVAPLLEEWLLRGVAWEALRRIGPQRTVLFGTALLFAMMHGLGGGGWLEFPHRFVGGLALGLVRIKTGALWPCVLAHFVWNGLAVYLVD
jgi:membrane protease YdiL (CAAX protease family)